MAFDIEQIKADVSRVISYSQDISNPKVDELNMIIEKFKIMTLESEIKE